MATEIIKTVKPSGGDYSSLSAFESGEQRDLVTADEIATAECYSMSDTTAVTIVGWTTDATRYIRVYTPTSERHDGKWNSTKYRMEITSAAAVYPIWIKEDYVRVDGLQIKSNMTASGNVYHIRASNIGASNDIRISNMVITSTVGDSAAQCNGIALGDVDVNAKIWNCLIYDMDGSSVEFGIYLKVASAEVYNCTTAGNGSAGIYDIAGSTVTAKNCASFNNADDFKGTFTAIDHCASDDGDGTNAVTPSDWSTVFVDYTNGDYHLLSTDTDLIGAGVDDPGSGLYSDDIDGETRTSTWDIGADEYVSAGGTTYYTATESFTLGEKITGVPNAIQKENIQMAETIIGYANALPIESISMNESYVGSISGLFTEGITLSESYSALSTTIAQAVSEVIAFVESYTAVSDTIAYAIAETIAFIESYTAASTTVAKAINETITLIESYASSVTGAVSNLWSEKQRDSGSWSETQKSKGGWSEQ